MSFKKELEWHLANEELPVLPKHRLTISVFIVAETGYLTSVTYSKYGFNTTDWTGTSDERPEEEERKYAIKARAWAYIPDDWNETFFPEENEVAEDETV